MPDFATGRSRDVDFELYAEEKYEGHIGIGSDFFPLQADAFGYSAVSGWRHGLEVHVSLISFGIVEDSQSGNDSYNHFGATLRLSVTVTIEGVMGSPLTLTQDVSATGGFFHRFLDAGDPVVGGAWIASDVNATLGLTGSYTEYLHGAAGLETLSEKLEYLVGELAAGGSATFRVSAAQTGHPGAAAHEDLVFAFSITDSWDQAPSVSSYLNLSEYQHSIGFSGLAKDFRTSSPVPQQTLTGSFIAAGPGLSYSSESVSGGAGAEHLSGTPTSASAYSTRTRTTTGYGTASVTASPQWAYDLQVSGYGYPSREALPFDTQHYWGTTPALISSATDGHHVYPSNGFGSSLAAVAGVTTVISRAQAVHNCSTSVSDPAGRSYVRASAAWADDYGTQLDTVQGGGAAVEVFMSPDFDAGTLSVEDTHAFAAFTAAANFTDPGFPDPDLTYDAGEGALKKVSAGSLSIANWPGSWLFKPFGYRYFRFQVKADVDSLPLRLQIGSNAWQSSAFGGDLSWWDFTLGPANVWQTLEFDLAIPDLRNTFGTPPDPAVQHPWQFAAVDPGDVTFRLISTYPSPATFYFKGLEGYHRSDGSRTPALLLGPLMTVGAPTQEVDEYASAGNAYAQPHADSGGLGFRVLMNGTEGFEVGAGADLASLWSDLEAFLDDATGSPANDSGIHVTPGASDWAPYADSWVLRDPLAAALPLDEDVTIQAVRRVTYLYGYYGSGDFAAGTYGATLAFRGDKVFGGEVVGAGWDGAAPVSGAEVALIDNDSASLLVSGTSDDDGMVRLPWRAGKRFPYSNAVPGTAEFTGTTPDTVAYTTQGLRMNAWWLKSDNFQEKDGQSIAIAGGVRTKYPIFDRHPNLFDLLLQPASRGEPWNLHDRYGRYYRAYVVEGAINVNRADRRVPPFAVSVGSVGLPAPSFGSSVVVTAGGNDHRPRLAHDEMKLILVFYRQVGAGTPNCYEAWSYDHAVTWEAPFMSFAGGKYPDILHDDESGVTLRTAWIGNQLWGTLQERGEASPGAAFLCVDDSAVPLDLADDTYHVSVAPEDPRRYVLTCRRNGESVISEFASTDDGKTWRLVV